MSPFQMEIARLGLRGAVLEFAKALAKEHPDVVYTSGLRMRTDQARAMAENIVAAGPKWVEKTYLKSKARDRILEWLNSNAWITTKDALAVGLSDVMDGLTNDELSKLSRHFNGEALDIKPVDGLTGQMILRTIKKLCALYKLKLIEREGGLRKWHIQTR